MSETKVAQTNSKKRQSERTLPATFYRSKDLYEESLDSIFARSWQLVGRFNEGESFNLGLKPGMMESVTLLPGSLNEPLLLTRTQSVIALLDQNKQNNSKSKPDGNLQPEPQFNLTCLSNVCTHRGALLLETGKEEAIPPQGLRCRYHGRRFNCDGTFQSAPGFENVDNFPEEADHLKKIEIHNWGPFTFASLNPACSFEEFIEPMRERLAFLDLDKLVYQPELSCEYDIEAHWALYVDNYLEGLHIPFVHPSLSAVLDLKNYRTELFAMGNLQLGAANSKADTFDLPPQCPDFGQAMGAYYYYLFPNMMFNFYPWGLSLNIVAPTSHKTTKVYYRTFVLDPSRMQSYSPSDIKQTEMEDEDVVELVQKGIQSRVYKSGRYAPVWEQGVRQFHGLIAKFMDKNLALF